LAVWHRRAGPQTQRLQCAIQTAGAVPSGPRAAFEPPSRREHCTSAGPDWPGYAVFRLELLIALGWGSLHLRTLLGGRCCTSDLNPSTHNRVLCRPSFIRKKAWRGTWNVVNATTHFEVLLAAFLSIDQSVWQAESCTCRKTSSCRRVLSLPRLTGSTGAQCIQPRPSRCAQGFAIQT
jgi:hypothetical protein